MINIKNCKLLLLLILFSCSDNIKLRESDLIKYPWLTPFIIDKTGNIEGFNNIDAGLMEFSYKIDSNNKHLILLKIDSIAENEKWMKLFSNNSVRKFSKTISENQNYGGNIVMELKLDTILNRIHFKID